MKKTVSFNKDIIFDNLIGQINSISLEHEVDKQEEGFISGKFIVSGDYKVTASSTHLDNFKYDLPFSIEIDKKYNIDNALVDISDFYYEIINDKTLSVDIELMIDNIEENISNREMGEDILEEKVNEVVLEDNTLKDEDLIQERCVEEETNEIDTVKSIFTDFDDNENYVTYKIHIITENDTIESIINDYQVNREMLENYNDLSEIKLGDKIIIPANES